MITRPRPIYHSECSNQVPVERYRPPRVCIGSDTRSLKMKLDRCAGFAKQESSLQVALAIPVPDKPEPLILDAFKVFDGYAYFNLDNAFPSKGLYRVDVLVNGCCVGVVEMQVAPPFHISDVEAVESECADSSWVEPPCNVDDSCAPAECDTRCIEKACPIEVLCVI